MNRFAATIVLWALSSIAAVAGTVTLPVPDFCPDFSRDSSGERITAPGYANVSSPGDPALPYKELHVIIPPNADPASVSVALTGSQVIREVGEHDVAPAPPAATEVGGREILDWGEGKRIEGGRNVLVYGKDAFYPDVSVRITNAGNMRRWRIVRVQYYPYRYNPVSRVLESSTGGAIAVSYGLSPAIVAYAPDTILSDRVSQLAANYAEASNWYLQPAESFQRPMSQQPSATSNYVILTTSAIVSGSSKLQAFVNHKTSRGFTVAVVTQSQWGGGVGDTAANNLRAYLKANYISKGIEYVLLIGNPTPTTGDVPMKMLWPRYSSSTYREAPSDYFYADLTGNWDLDGDGYYGEGDHDFGSGGVDLYPEVIVGRIPFYGSFTDLDSILQKIINYESGTIGGDWVRRALLSAKPSDASTPGYQLCEAIKSDVLAPAGLASTRVYEQVYGLNPQPEFTPCSYDNVLTAWQQHAGFHFWWTHGNETLAADVFSSDRTQYLDDRYPSFTFQCSCLNGSPETSNNLAYSLLKRGAIATDSATRVSWYFPGEVDYANTDSNAGMTYRYAAKLIGSR